MEKTLFGYDPIMSISFSNDEIIRNIMSLYDIKRFDLDCTYSIGQFWKNFPQPTYKSDLLPKREDIIKADSSNLPFDDNSLMSVMFDPPFVIGGSSYHSDKKGSSIIAKRFEGYKDYKSLKKHYYGTLKEVYRILKEDGILVVKCQDVVSSGKNHFTHNMLFNMALEIGYYPKDLFILLAKHRINAFSNDKWTKQYHARKHHSYFWILEKTKCKIDYEWED